MANIEKRRIINRNNLSGQDYFTSILQEAYACGLFSNSDVESIQLQCIKFLASKCEKYNCGESSSIRVEIAESIMRSNLYTIGLYLKSLPDADVAAAVLKKAKIPELYQKGRELINEKLDTAKKTYKKVLENKLITLHYSYNTTLDDSGIGTFLKLYDPDYQSHESPAVIDYQLCNPVIDLAGVEYIEKYLENLFFENEFCRFFSADDIHYLLCGYNEEYQELLINIFEQVFTAALGCCFANRSVVKLDISKEEIEHLYNEFSKDDHHLLALKIQKGTGQMLEELNVTSDLFRGYVEKSLPKITSNILQAVKTNTLDKTFLVPINPDLKPKIRFISGAKMDDKDYRKIIDEMLICRYSSDKLVLINDKIKSFGDLEDILFDAELSEEEINSVFDILGDMEFAALIKRHSYISDIQAVDLSEAEQTFRRYLKNYIDHLEVDRQEKIFEIVNQLIDD
ncbi:MAG: DUF6179 domain-containing protein [Desulfitobacteriaceae bacterium]|nr:DUF6179 domain-containing protein [Desulfitobacteriaceae bacterium]MDD4752017.1 DUF6179 domain-containing protein [Desulfitobacteriaceae bacterium]